MSSLNPTVQLSQAEVQNAARELIRQAEVHLTALQAQRASILEKIRQLRQITNGLLILQAQKHSAEPLQDDTNQASELSE